MGQMRNLYKTLVVKPMWEMPHAGSRRIKKDRIKMDLKELWAE
jgi:hypothetical protein